MQSKKDLTFFDAGLFIGALLKGDTRHAEARPIVESARYGDIAVCTSVGVLSEVYGALTWAGAQPPQNPAMASQAVRLLVESPSQIQILNTNLNACLKMLEIAASNRLSARRIHDARHAATALVNGVSRVYTYDVGDWQTFEPEGIQVVGPPSVITL